MSGAIPNVSSAGATACPVCTLYLREGISLQKHLDTHPKEQVIEALIRASSGTGGGTSTLLGQTCAPQPQQSHTPVPTPAPTPTPSLTSLPTPSPGAQSQQQQVPALSSSPHVPHAQSPYPIGPIFECPPINAMIPPPQFTSFSYQQFVNNGSMMIPAQYAMAQAQPPQASQMMQMLYSPFGMYHQQQIPTVQMISAPPMMPTTTTTLPTAMPAATTRIRPATSTSNVTLTAINETTTASPPRPLSCTQQQSPQPEQQQQQHQQMVHIESPKHAILQDIVEGPSSILPDLEEPAPEHTVIQQNQREVMHVENREQQTQSNCRQEEERNTNDQYQTEDPPMLLSSNSCADNTDDDKTERILPDIDDTQEIESLLVRKLDRIERNKDTEMQIEESIQYVQTADDGKTVNEEITEITQSSQVESRDEFQEKSDDNIQIVKENLQPENLSTESAVETQSCNINKPEIEQLSRLLVNIESEFNNVEITNNDSVRNKINSKEIQDSSLAEPLEKSSEEEENTSTYVKNIPEPIECKIIVEHEDTDVSSIASEDSIQCHLEIQKMMTSSYTYKYSQSLPTTPISKKKIYRSLSRTSLRSDFDHLNENICSYPIGFEATSLHDYLKDNFTDENMDLEDQHSYQKQNAEIIMERSRSHASLSTSLTCASLLKARRTKVPSSSASVHSISPYCQMMDDEDEDEDDDSEAESCVSDHLHDKDDDEEDEEEEEDDQSLHENIECDEKKVILLEDDKSTIITDILQQQQSAQPADFRTQSLMTEHYSTVPYATDHHLSTHQMQQQTHSIVSMHQETYPLSNVEISQNLLNMSECIDPMASTDSKSYCSSSKSIMQKPTTELLNISEDAHAGPMNVFEFDGLQILVPSTFISESSQKAVSGTSQQSMSSSENGVGNDEEVKSVNMRADETMPPRGELSEQESNGCTEQSAWQLYMGQESSRMSTSYDLMARESWEESEGSDHDDHNGGPLLDSRSLATHFTSSLFLDRDRKTPTRQIFKCSHCPEVFECPKERRVHSTMIHKEAGPSSCSNDNMDQPELKDIKLLDSRVNVFEDIFVPGGLHMQQAYQHHQQPVLHQLQPLQHCSSSKIADDSKIDPLHLSVVSEVVCNLCNQRFSSEKSLQIHRRRMHIVESIKRVRENAKCQICSEEFTSVASFNLHLKIHPLECGQCGKYFYRKQNFKLHMKRHLGIKPFPCTVCDKAFLTKQKLDEHTNGHTGNAPVKCNLCNETFRRYSNLTQHKNRHHLNIKKKLKDYICHCGEVFHTKKKLAWHKETHDEKPKACTYCNERFIHMASLTRHMRRAHNRRFVPDAQRENENVECPICKCIYLRSSLAVHMRVHNGERPYECQVCSKAFSTKWNLQLHKWTHAARSTKPFKCNQCSAAFYRHSDYTAHMNSHRNVRPYTCNYCGAQFIRKYNCLRHVKEHEENKAYTCDVCNKTFHRSYYLKEHLRVHSGARPYTCHICGKSSSTKSNHNKHVRIHHAREPVNTEN